MFATQDAVDIVLLPETYRFRGTLHHVTPKHLILTCHREDVAFCQPGQRVIVSQVKAGICYQIETTILQTHPAGFAIANLPPRKMERRRSPRVECSLSAKYLHLRQRTLGSKVVEEGDRVALVQDLSIGGAKMAVTEIIIAGAPLRLHLEMAPSETIEAEASVIRCTATPSPIRHDGRFLTVQAMVKFETVSRPNQLRLVRFMHQHLGAETTLIETAPEPARKEA